MLEFILSFEDLFYNIKERREFDIAFNIINGDY